MALAKRLSVNAGRDRQITDGIGQNNGVGGLTWLPDGRVVYVSRAYGSQDIWLMDQDGKNQRQLTTAETRIDRYPAVTPDGRYIVFVSTRTGNSNIYRYELNTGEQKQLTSGASEEFPAVSADGKWVIYAATGSIKHTLWKVSIDGGEPAQLTDKLSTWPDVSPERAKDRLLVSRRTGSQMADRCHSNYRRRSRKSHRRSAQRRHSDSDPLDCPTGAASASSRPATALQTSGINLLTAASPNR